MYNKHEMCNNEHMYNPELDYIDFTNAFWIIFKSYQNRWGEAFYRHHALQVSHGLDLQGFFWSDFILALSCLISFFLWAKVQVCKIRYYKQNIDDHETIKLPLR